MYQKEYGKLWEIISLDKLKTHENVQNPNYDRNGMEIDNGILLTYLFYTRWNQYFVLSSDQHPLFH